MKHFFLQTQTNGIVPQCLSTHLDNIWSFKGDKSCSATDALQSVHPLPDKMTAHKSKTGATKYLMWTQHVITLSLRVSLKLTLFLWMWSDQNSRHINRYPSHWITACSKMFPPVSGFTCTLWPRGFLLGSPVSFTIPKPCMEVDWLGETVPRCDHV